jgi:voltage-gated potassium channel
MGLPPAKAALSGLVEELRLKPSGKSNPERPMPQTRLPKPLKIQRRPIPAFRFSVRYFLAALILNLLISPFVDQLSAGDMIQTILMTLVLLSTVLSIAGKWKVLTGVVLVTPAVVGQWLNYLWPSTSIYVITRGAGLLFIGFVVVELLRFIQHAPRVDSEILCAAVAGYLLAGLAWSLAYDLLDHVNPNAFVSNLPSRDSQSMHGFTSVYFSFITLATVGYGDFVPASPVARMLAIAEAMFGMFYVTLLIARLVSLYSAETPRKVGSTGIEDAEQIGPESSTDERSDSGGGSSLGGQTR